MGHKVKIKESEKNKTKKKQQQKNKKLEKRLNFARELKHLRNVKVIVIPVIVGTLGTIHKSLENKNEWTRSTGKNCDGLNHSID